MKLNPKLKYLRPIVTTGITVGCLQATLSSPVSTPPVSAPNPSRLTHFTASVKNPARQRTTCLSSRLSLCTPNPGDTCFKHTIDLSHLWHEGRGLRARALSS